jgi:type II secretory pathway pseudopilin PulG
MISRLCYNYGEMKLNKTTGFTIIETMLFLAISGFLFVAILASTGNSINVQRYRDSVNSLQSFLQKQYSDIVNVSNESAENSCNNTSIARGQSDCVILGRFIVTANDGKSLNVYKVIGFDNVNVDSEDGDIATFQNYNVQLFKNDSGEFDYETYDFEWGVLLNNDIAGGGGVSSFSVLLIRSPNSGMVRTFSDNSSESVSNEKVNQLISDAATAISIKACVDSNGLIEMPESAILIHANAAVQTDIEVIGDESSGC